MRVIDPSNVSWRRSSYSDTGGAFEASARAAFGGGAERVGR
ncbi:hypothetical protein ACIQVL_25620 [Streptomyces sp. NPDC090499]